MEEPILLPVVMDSLSGEIRPLRFGESLPEEYCQGCPDPENNVHIFPPKALQDMYYELYLAYEALWRKYCECVCPDVEPCPEPEPCPECPSCPEIIFKEYGLGGGEVVQVNEPNIRSGDTESACWISFTGFPEGMFDGDLAEALRDNFKMDFHITYAADYSDVDPNDPDDWGAFRDFVASSVTWDGTDLVINLGICEYSTSAYLVFNKMGRIALTPLASSFICYPAGFLSYLD